MDRSQITIFVGATIAVFMGSIARRAKELNDMQSISSKTLFRMFGIEMMLTPAYAACAGAFVMSYDLPLVMVLPVGIAAGLGGFATATLIFELFSVVLTTLASKIGKTMPGDKK